jgi:hypothetical protein
MLRLAMRCMVPSASPAHTDTTLGAPLGRTNDESLTIVLQVAARVRYLELVSDARDVNDETRP